MVFLWVIPQKNPSLPEGINIMDGKTPGPCPFRHPQRNPPKNPQRVHLGEDLPHFELAITEAHGRRATQALSQPGDDNKRLTQLSWFGDIFWGDWIITSHKTWGFSCVQWLNGIEYTLNQQTSSNLWLVEMTFTSGVSGTKKHWPWTTLNLVSPRRR